MYVLGGSASRMKLAGAEVFTVHPRASSLPLLADVVRRYGVLNPPHPLSGWSNCREVYFSDLQAVPLNPFSPPMIDPSFLVADGRQDNADAVEDFVFGHDCVMDDEEWAVFCREILLLKDPIAQTMDAVVGMVDEMVIFLVRAISGCSEFSIGTGPRLMDLVVVLVRFLMLCGGSGVLPRDYALARFGDVCPLVAGGPFAQRGGRERAHRMMRRLVSLGRCVRGLLRAAWEGAVWRDPELAGLLGLSGGGSWKLSEVWRAAMGKETAFSMVMENIIGPSYYQNGTGWQNGFIVHEYFSSTWVPSSRSSPMCSETIPGAVIPMLVAGSGTYAGYGGVDRQYQLFLHNLHWAFMQDQKYAEMRGDDVFPRDFLAVFGITVGKRVLGGAGNREFRVAELRSWLIGGGDCVGLFGDVRDEDVMEAFLLPLCLVENPGDTVEAVRARRRGKHRAAMLASMVQRGVASSGGVSDADVMALVAGVSLDDE